MTGRLTDLNLCARDGENISVFDDHVARRSGPPSWIFNPLGGIFKDLPISLTHGDTWAVRGCYIVLPSVVVAMRVRYDDVFDTPWVKSELENSRLDDGFGLLVIVHCIDQEISFVSA